MSENDNKTESKFSWLTLGASSILTVIITVTITANNFISSFSSLVGFLSVEKVKIAINVANFLVSGYAALKLLKYWESKSVFEINKFELFRKITDVDIQIEHKQDAKVDKIFKDIKDIENKINDKELEKKPEKFKLINFNIEQNIRNLEVEKQKLQEKANDLTEDYIVEREAVKTGNDSTNRKKDIEDWHETNNKRVGILVKQFTGTIIAFALSLVFTYFFILASDVTKLLKSPPVTEKPNQTFTFTGNIKNESSDFSQGNINVKASSSSNVRIEYNLEQNKGNLNIESENRSLPFKLTDEREIDWVYILANILNFIGCLAVFASFSSLYIKTVRDGKTSAKFYLIPFLALCFYVAIIVTFTQIYSQLNLDKTIWLNLFDLLAGLFNGLAGTLLFGRYVSIEQSLRYTEKLRSLELTVFGKEVPFKEIIISFGIVFVLPIYALAQPLFGTLQIDAFGDPRYFQLSVYLICLIGKICFFHLTYLLIKNNSFHLYLYGLISEVGNLKELEACLGDRITD
jgi:hypothetical protein